MSDSLAHSDFNTRGEPLPPMLLKLRGLALVIGVVCIAIWACAALFSGDPAYAYRSYLFAYIFWVGITLSCMTLVMLSHMTGGEWGVVCRRFGETAFMNLPLLLLFFLPLIGSYRYLFPWGHAKDFSSMPDVISVLDHREPWYNSTMFTCRNIAIYIIWIMFALIMSSGSRQLDRADNPAPRRRLRMVSAGGMVLYFVTVTSFAMDFLMSRETHWYSSILGFIIAVGQCITGMAFMTLMVCYFADRKPIKDVLKPQHLNDYGNLLLAMVILWAYTSFAQLLVIWNGDMKSDAGYYAHRGLGWVPNPWRWVALFLIVGHFFVPFFLLLMKGLKRKVPTLAGICCLLLFMRIIGCLWETAPSGPQRGWELGGVYWTDPFAWLGMGGLWLFVYLFRLGNTPLLPKNADDQPDILTDGAHVAPAH